MSRWAAAEAGPVTPKEAKEILSRFNASHWRQPDKERARYTIPADGRRDDDIRMGAFIEHVEALVKAAEELLKWDSMRARCEVADALDNLRGPASAEPSRPEASPDPAVQSPEPPAESR